MFKLGDNVFFATDPINTTDGSYAVECTIIGIESIQRSDSYEVTRYEVRFGLLDDDRMVKPTDLFLSKEEALISIQSIVNSNILRFEKRLEQYRRIKV